MIGCLSYSTVNGENTDTFNLQNELDFSKNYEYDSDNRIISTTISALSLAYDYDDESVGSLSYSLAQGATKSFSYQYDENGNIISEQVAVDGVSADITAYEYDDDNQLVSAENSSTKWTYSYDNRGNITAENEYSVSFNESGEKVYTPKENGADSYTYDTSWKDKLTSFNGQTISYDASGNPTNYLGHNLSWTMGRQLASYDNTTYSYNESGIRTSKTVGENTTEFYLNGTNIIYQTDGTNDIYFFYDRNNEIVGFKYENNNYFYVKNQMGDITDIANSNGEVVASYTYDPWGSVLSVTGSDTAIGNLNPFRYRSYYYDSDIQMYYLQSRYYDPEVGRFINCDDVNYIGLTESSVSYNPFAYCENEPVSKNDANGFISINLSKIKSSIFGKLAQKISKFWLDGYEHRILSFTTGSLTLYISISVGTTLGKLKTVSVSSNSITISSNNFSTKLGRSKVTYSISCSFGPLTAKLSSFIGSRGYGIGVSFISTIYLSNGIKLGKVSVNFVVESTYLVLGLVAATITGACVVIPYAVPLVKQITKTLLILNNPRLVVSSLYPLSRLINGFVRGATLALA